MHPFIGAEPLESRSHFASSTALDPKYVVGAQDVYRQMGDGFTFFQAVPGRAGRTYLLADKRPDADPTPTPTLAIIAIDANGKLDAGFGDNGIAVTGFVTQPHSSFNSPGVLKVARTGYLYFADDSRVMRFRPNGAVDRTFGNRGSITFSDSSHPTALADIAPTDDGVLIATTKAFRGVEYFDVVKVDRKRYSAIWSAKHNTGVRSYEFNGAYDETYAVGGTNLQQLRTGQMQFAQGDGGLTLVRIESDRAWYATPLPDFPKATSLGVTRQDVVVTRFTDSGMGTDFTRREMKRPDEYAAGQFGDAKDGPYTLYQSSAVLINRGHELVVQTDQELLRFILNFGNGYARRTPLPGAGNRDFNSPTYRLLPDGGLYVIDSLMRQPDKYYSNITRYTTDGRRDFTFADGPNGALLSVLSRDFTSGTNEPIRQLFISSTGRFSFVAGNLATTDQYDEIRPATLTIRQL